MRDPESLPSENEISEAVDSAITEAQKETGIDRADLDALQEIGRTIKGTYQGDYPPELITLMMRLGLTIKENATQEIVVDGEKLTISLDPNSYGMEVTDNREEYREAA